MFCPESYINREYYRILELYRINAKRIKKTDRKAKLMNLSDKIKIYRKYI